MLKSEGSECPPIDNSSDWTEIMRQLNLKAIQSRSPPIAYYTASANDTIRFRRQIRVSKHLCSEGRGYVCHRPAATGHGQEKEGNVMIQYKMMFRSEGEKISVFQFTKAAICPLWALKTWPMSLPPQCRWLPVLKSATVKLQMICSWPSR